MQPIVIGGRRQPSDDDGDTERAAIQLDEARFGPEAIAGLDAIDGAPVLDIEPYRSGFAARGAAR